MKEVTMKLYTFSELSEDVQKSIVEKERFNVMGEAMECYGSDWEGSLKKFEELTDTTLRGWQVDYCGCYAGRVRFNHDGSMLGDYESGFYPHELKGKYLFRYLNKHILPYIVQKKTYWGKYKYEPDGIRLKCTKRTSRILYSSEVCTLTGYCGDHSLVKTILDYCREWPKHPEITLEDLYADCYAKFMDDWHQDYRGCATDEYVYDGLVNRDTLYLEDGTRFMHSSKVV